MSTCIRCFLLLFSSSGVLLRCRHHRAPGLFDPDTIKRNVGDNWALKLTNLKKVNGLKTGRWRGVSVVPRYVREKSTTFPYSVVQHVLPGQWLID